MAAITGEVVEVGPGVEFVEEAVYSVHADAPAGAVAATARKATRHAASTSTRDRPGSAYGYVDMGWAGRQADHALVPYADWSLLKVPDKDQAMEKILDLTMLSDIFPTGFHGASRRA